MTTLYRHILIESAEQAEALPVGTVSIDLDSQGQPRQASIRVRCGWYCTGEVAADGSPWLAPHGAMVGDYALVPIEAEEEAWLAGPDKPIVNGQRIDRTAHRWCTPWEEA